MTYLPHALLAALTLLGYLGLHHLGHNDGLFPTLEKVGESGIYPIQFTSIGPVKDLSSILVGFFYPTVDGSYPGLTLACYVFVGQGFAFWMTVMIEGVRQGNRMRAVYFTSIFGAAVQLIGAAVVVPAWLLLHLLTSPTTTKPTQKSLLVSYRTLVATPLAILLGFIVPTVVMSLPSPSILSFQGRVNALLLWQPFPIWTGILQAILAFVIPEPRSIDRTRVFRYVYGSVIAVSAIVHVSAMTLAIAPLVAPVAFDNVAGQQLSAALLSFPPHPFSTAKITSVAEGALWFIQYDYATSSWAFLIWAFTLRSAVWEDSGAAQWLRSVGATAIKAVLLGPMAASTLLIWERDEAVELGEDKSSEVQRKKKA